MISLIQTVHTDYYLYHKIQWYMKYDNALCFGAKCLCDFSGPSGRPVHLLWESVSVSGGESEVEESLCISAEQLHHQPLWEQNSGCTSYSTKQLSDSMIWALVLKTACRVCYLSNRHTNGGFTRKWPSTVLDTRPWPRWRNTWSWLIPACQVGKGQRK